MSPKRFGIITGAILTGDERICRILQIHEKWWYDVFPSAGASPM
jgi:hypothetical protein